MSTIVEATVPASEFVLGETLDRYPEAEFEMIKIVASGTESPFPLLWGQAESSERFPEVIEADPTTSDVEVLSNAGDEILLRMELRPRKPLLTHLVGKENGTILGATAANGTWRFRILFADRESLSRSFDFSEEDPVDLTIHRVYQASESVLHADYGLTQNQYTTIQEAFESGYYDVPRETTLEEIAAGLDVSHQALSERLRRGHQTLIARTLQPTRTRRTESN